MVNPSIVNLLIAYKKRSRATSVDLQIQRENLLVFMKTLTPSAITRYLDKYIISQKAAKRAISVALRNRYRRMKLKAEMRENITPKNLLMIGPTGVGKTEIARKIARLIGAPFVKVEATKYTEVGYVGRDVESMIRDLVAASISLVRKEIMEQNKKLIEQRVASRILKLIKRHYPDMLLEKNLSDQQLLEEIKAGNFMNLEVDVETKSPNPLQELTNNVGIIGIEGQMPDFSKLFGNNKKTKRVTFEKAKELFAQEETDKIADEDQVVEVAKWRAENLGIVFIDEFDKIAKEQQVSGSVNREGVQRDILPIVEGSQVHTRYGIIDTSNILFIAAGAFYVSKPSDLIPELQGRFPVRVELNELTKDDFVKILSETENSMFSQYQHLLSAEDFELTYEEGVFEYIAEIAYKMNAESENIGARRLYTVLEKLFEDLLFDTPDKQENSFVITKNYVETQLEDIIKSKDYYKYIL